MTNSLWRQIGSGMFLALLCSFTWAAGVPEPQGNDEVVKQVVELLTNSDREMRMLGLQFVREEVRGAAATKRFAALLPKLPAESQAALLEALGERRDSAARPAVVDMLRNDQESVRVAALHALGNLGGAEDVRRLVQQAGRSKAERQAATQALIKLRSEGVNPVLAAALKDSLPPDRVILLQVLGGRNATEALPVILASAGDTDRAVRLAALAALRSLAGPQNTAAIVKLVKTVRDGTSATRPNGRCCRSVDVRVRPVSGS